jgi:hypothetical protein
MSNNAEEIDIWKRLAVVEDAVEELKKQDLNIAKMITSVFGSVAPNMVARTLKDEELKAFIEFRSKKLGVLLKELKQAKTVKSAFDILLKLDEELADYVKAKKIDTAEKAMDIAHSFIKKYSPVALPLKADKQGTIWLVDVDVGALATKIAKVKVDAKTGDVLSYDIPQRESKESR